MQNNNLKKFYIHFQNNDMNLKLILKTNNFQEKIKQRINGMYNKKSFKLYKRYIDYNTT